MPQGKDRARHKLYCKLYLEKDTFFSFHQFDQVYFGEYGCHMLCSERATTVLECHANGYDRLLPQCFRQSLFVPPFSASHVMPLSICLQF